MGEDRLLAVRRTYFEALSAYTHEVGEALQLLTVTTDKAFDQAAFAAQLRREAEALENLREVRRLYVKELADWEKGIALGASAG